ncbi:midasin (ATPase involved in ribosome maturation) [Rhodoblastus acidophilus]|uniref:hypothetical protein n=1 Tax=Rhodoblastus acidophilus TaxID=1074 RepID=UPI0022242DA5|nr:hypothetical protein [Rhodoblastus acidophilus]MCW2283621.1 midasin (ATPase involved in ribosome maturation) [Rhodoblastus acidophilus]MCW2332481.1 midasin (ATPase involved in ribosome maturation) [Rhodoblastus acidophilus]
MKRKRKNTATRLSFIVISLVWGNLCIAESINDLDSLLSSYEHAKKRYSMAWQPSEIEYWNDQYMFYKTKIDDYIESEDKAVKENPKVFCLDVLRDYQKIINAEQHAGYLFARGYIMLNEVLDWMKRQLEVSTYCGRYDIYYNPYREKMQ